MPQREKATVRTTIILNENDKKNVVKDIVRLNASLAELGVTTNVSQFVRLVARDLHQALEKGQTIHWPPSLKVKKDRADRI